MVSGRTHKNLINLLFMFLVLSFGFSGCDLLNSDDDDDDANDDLYVQFNNNSSSVVTITSIELQAIGKADETPTPTGSWSDNILKDLGEIPPGGQQYFHTDIPNLHRCYYRLGVKTNDGSTIMLHEKTSYPSDEYPTLTHWGSDERTVSVTFAKDETTGSIYVNGWGDWAGIED